MDKHSDALVVLGDQLFSKAHFKPFHGFPTYMCEDLELCTHFKYHKKKIALFLTSMREFAKEYSETLKIDYQELGEKATFFDGLEKFIKKHKTKTLHSFEIQDKFFEKQMEKFCEDFEVTLTFHESPAFLVTRDEFATYLEKNKRPFMKTFYEKQRIEKQILMESEKLPKGGKFSFDTENRKPYRGERPVPPLPTLRPPETLKKVMKLVEERFPSHPGELEDFIYPVTRAEARTWLKDFVKHRLADFGVYEDAIDPNHPFLFHSLLSPLMNLGLLTPQEVLDVVIPLAEEQGVPLNSLEGFVRQVIGWREFVHGIYRGFSEKQDKANFWKHHRQLTDDWYEGTTGLPPVDDVIKQVQKHGYCHHIERLMIMGNTMLLSQIDPREAHRWFMEMYVDSADWVMGPNVYGMGIFSDGGIFATKPYICGSNYWLKMSNYKKGEWCDVIDGLYWGFIENHQDFFTKNPRLSIMTRLLAKIPAKRRAILKSAAIEFIKTKTKA